jgi:hypothetical protein
VLAAALLVRTVAAHAAEVVDRFTFVAPNAPESTVDGKGPLDLVISHWSNDADRDRVQAAMAGEGPATVLSALGHEPNAGYMRWPGGIEYSIRYAYRISRPDGGTDVVLLADRPLWVWWDAAGVKPTTTYPFTLVHIRVDKDGRGEGRSSLTASVRADRQTGVALADEAQAAVVMRDVRIGGHSGK